MVGVGMVFILPKMAEEKENKINNFKNDESKDKEEKEESAGYPYLDKNLSIEERVKDLLSRMTTSEKIGQLALVEKNSVKDPTDITHFGIGALLSGGGSGKPNPNTPEAWLHMVNNFQAYAKKTRLGIPLLYGVDTPHGHSNIPGATIFPHSIGLGATRDPHLVRRIGRATALEMAATNIFWSFTPNLDVTKDIRWGRVYETFGSDPKLVTLLGEAYIEGFQKDLPNNLKTATTAKHFVGAGAMTWGSSFAPHYFIDQGVSNMNEASLRAQHLPPFEAAVKSGVQTIMAGHNAWQGKRISANHYLLTEVLKKELGFDGIVVSDWHGVYEISRNKYESIVTAINAGIDMVMLPYDYQSFVDNMNKALENGDISKERLDDAVSRILLVKFRLGLFDRDLQTSPDLSVLGFQEHREIAREAVRKSLVLLKNEKKVLPLSKEVSRIRVSGKVAHNLGWQSGGWTVEWQGFDGNRIPGTTILNGIQSTAKEKTIVEFSETADFPEKKIKADVGIAIVGEKPYAEGWGDKANPTLSKVDLLTIEKTRAVSKQLVVIIVSGRPLDIKKYQKDWDAIVAAWLPGSEGGGVADVLFGDYPFIGVLPVAWKL